ncbi:hypothetical protein SKAU_G00314770 [Synaphobranchus kaupii]|uniref:IF rod domain-containing protein n=1 Tax=Synaphobranchus kaupii TaxID=118154 RepID=A0A9Q1ESK4_SYNKA|nr:hypothetical protein SKAU_G00314770 [Synaphobranchus kaupii]
MLQFRRTFENEKIQLQDLNTRLRQYLSRVKELEQDNALLITELNTVRQERTVEWEKQYMTELRDLRRAVNQLTLEKSKAEMEREKLGRELQAMQALCCEETVICRDIEGERKGCEKQLQQALKKNAALEERLLQLENEYMCLEDVHRQDISHLDVLSRAPSVIVTQNDQGLPAVTMEEIEEYSQMMSQSLMENFEVYRRRVEDLEEAIKADQAKMEDLHREKTQYASELKKLHAEAHKQNKLQLHLEDDLMQMQDRFHLEVDRYQGIMDELEEEHRVMAHTMAEKLKEYQQLMQVKMGLSLEVATYSFVLKPFSLRSRPQNHCPSVRLEPPRRALLEGERQEPIQKMDQYARETSRRIDIKMPAQPWSTTTRQEVRKQYLLSTGPEARYTDLASNLKTSFESTNIRSTSPARLIPISIYGRDQHSAPARRDMPSFTKPSQATAKVQKSTVEERSVRTKEALQKPAKDSAKQCQPGFATRPSPGPAPTKEKTTVLTHSTESTVLKNGKGDSNDKTDGREEKDTNKVTVKEWITPGREDVRTSNVLERSEIQTDDPQEAGSSKREAAATNIQTATVEERSVRTKEVLQKPAKDSSNQHQPGFSTRPSPGPAPTRDKTTVLTHSTESTVLENGKGDSKHDLRQLKVDKTEGSEEKDTNKVTVKEWITPGRENVRTSNVLERLEVQCEEPEEAGSSDEKMVDYIYMEEIIEKVMRPAGLDTKFISASPDSKVAYRVEKTEDEDGKMKTQIILESRVEEDVDITDDSALEELLNKGVRKVALEDIKGTSTGSAIQNLLSLGHHEGAGDLENKSINVEIIEEPAEDRGDEEGEANPAPTFDQPSSMFVQIEELDNDSHGAKLPGGKTEVSKPTPTEDTEYLKEESVWVREGYREADNLYFSHAQETEYFVSTPDDSISESEEERGISSYGHYGVVDDLSDERYYQEVPPINPRFEEDKGYRSGHRSSYMTSEHVFAKDRFPECIIEEEVQVSPTVQESMLELPTEDSMDPKQQLRGAPEKLQGNVSESLQDELSLEGPENLSVDVKKVEQVSDNGTVTITAKLNVSQDLEDFLEDSESVKQVLASSHPGLQHAIGSKTVREYTVKVSRDQDAELRNTASTAGLDVPGLEGFRAEESANDVHKTERVIKLGPSERSLTFQMDIGNVGNVASLPAEGEVQEFQGFFSQSLGAGAPSDGEVREGVYRYVRKTTVSNDQDDEPSSGHSHEWENMKWDDLTKQQVEYGRVLQTEFVDPQLKVSQEKKIATVYLDSDKNN